jgi:hypothetical protein
MSSKNKGDVIANYAGPAIVLSFIISGLATCIAGNDEQPLIILLKFTI